MEKPENLTCRPRKMTRHAANTGSGKRRRSTSGTTVMPRPTNTCRSGTTLTTPRYWRSARSGMMIDDAVSISCRQPTANAASATAASTSQSRVVMSRYVIRRLSMPSMVSRARRARHTPPGVIARTRDAGNLNILGGLAAFPLPVWRGSGARRRRGYAAPRSSVTASAGEDAEGAVGGQALAAALRGGPAAVHAREWPCRRRRAGARRRRPPRRRACGSARGTA